MKTLILCCILAVGCASVEHRTTTTMPDDTVIVTEFTYSRFMNQEIHGLHVKKGETVVDLDSQKAENDAVMKSLAELLEITKTILKRVP